jgi:hypothetical protein
MMVKIVRNTTTVSLINAICCVSLVMTASNLYPIRPYCGARNIELDTRALRLILLNKRLSLAHQGKTSREATIQSVTRSSIND